MSCEEIPDSVDVLNSISVPICEAVRIRPITPAVVERERPRIHRDFLPNCWHINALLTEPAVLDGQCNPYSDMTSNARYYICGSL